MQKKEYGVNILDSFEYEKKIPAKFVRVFVSNIYLLHTCLIISNDLRSS